MRWVRALISIMFCLAIVYGFVTKLITSETFMAVAMVAITWWFKARDEEKIPPKP